MILTYEQADRFYTLINALLGYANERFEVVRELPLPIVDLESQSKAALVAETLWDSVGIIDDFVRENPFDLPKRFLDTALAWKDALTGSFVFAGHEDGRALLMGDEDVFAVAGIQLEPSELLSEWPDVVRTTLLPFDDLIVYDGMLNVLGIEFGPEVAASAQADFKERRAKGLVRTAADFVARSRALNEAGRNRAVERLLADAERDARIAAFGEQLPPGFHRGALAGLTEAERAAAFDERFDAWDEGRFEQKEAILRERALDREPAGTLEACLGLYTKTELEGVGRLLGLKGLSKLRKAELARAVAESVPSSSELLRDMLAACSPGAFRTAKELACEGAVSFGAEDVSRRLYLTPLMPYTFLFWQGGRFTAFAPEQTKCMLADVDFEEIERVRVRNEEVVTCAEACTTFYGVVSLDDAYQRYREACSDPVTRRRFVELIEVEASFFECGFELWERDGVDHLVHYAIGNDYAASEYARLHAPDFLDDLTSLADEVVDEDLIEKALHRMGEGLGSEWEELDGYRRFLLEEHAKNPPRPLDPSALQRDALGALFELSTVVQLRNFLDARVPDGEDDFFFADRVVEALVMGAMEGAGIQDLFAYVRELGLDACCEDDERLPKLITNVYNSLPSWENNGWSPQELLERMAGKKVFYNEKGDVMKVGRNDPCPCGSGKKYKKCCGR
ncbi:SEC-C metal-binding domain-containing protein [Eggerthella lenta]|uniref:SEC-C metal-binding domain-containing protein n=1 Tax=Eggerthella lenta TaxID=84112 RepID=UPI00189BC9E1|nr:SEC-C metal-binding domain-containing protein [Eggerthella lenta]MDB1805699.1 SEC-C metal-binding domain-containing protein [Eggerthella lenta]